MKYQVKKSRLAATVTLQLGHIDSYSIFLFSDVLLHCRSLSHLGTRIGEDMSKLSMGNVDNIVRKSHIESSNNNLINLHGQSKVTTVKVESGVEHVLSKSQIASNNNNLINLNGPSIEHTLRRLTVVRIYILNQIIMTS
mgnify:CR=1 FL=1